MTHWFRRFFVIAAIFGLYSAASAQPKVEVYATGLINPIGIAVDGRGNLWVGEQGTGSGTTGSVSIVTPGGHVHPFLTGIPSTAPGYEPISAEHVAFDIDGKLLVLTGGGTALYSESVVVVDTAGFTPGGPPLSVNSRDTMYNIGGFVRANGAIPNPYRIVVLPGGDWYIVDASFNALLKRDRATGNLSVFTKFLPIGSVEAVPTGLAFDGRDLFVGTLTGIPIPEGVAKVYRVDSLGSATLFQGGFSSIVDVAFNPLDGSLFVLQHAKFSGGWVNGTGALLRLRNGYVDTLLTGMNRPAGMAFTPDGTLFISSVADDNILKVTGLNTSLEFSKLSLNFGSLLLNVADTLSFHIRNLDTSAHTLLGIRGPGSGLSLVNAPAVPVTLPGRGGISISVAFRPTVAGTVTDSLIITSDDAARPVTTIALSGKATTIHAVAQPGVMYAISAGVPFGKVNSLNTQSGTATELLSFGLSTIDGLAIRRGTGEFLGVATSGSGTALYRINPSTGEVGLLRRLPIANMSAVAFGNGDSLYGGTKSGNLYLINPFTGSYQLVGPSSGIPYYSFAISPKTGQLWASAQSARDTCDTLYNVGRTTGTVSRVGPMGVGRRASIAFDSSGTLLGLTGGADTPNVLISINGGTGVATWVGTETFNNFASLISRLDGTLTGIQASAAAPGTYSLSQNYPNPFNPATEIRYELPRAMGQGSGRGDVRLVVYDLLGREVATLVNESQTAGAYSVRWDANRMASGVYVYKLTADGFVQTRKMVLIR
jgi:hypothetical protein